MKSAAHASPEDAENAFYSAFQKADLRAMMEVWGPEGDVTCIHPGGTRLESKRAIQESWDRIFDQDTAMQFKLTGVRRLRGTDIAIHLVKEEIRIGGVVQGIVLATNVYRHFESGWLMVLHHASAQPDIDRDATSALH